MSERIADYPIDRLFLDRWSPRAFDCSPMSDVDLHTILEAARWAPSSFNAQPWHFVYAHREQSRWDELLGLLIPFNRVWACRAAALIFILSHRANGKRSPGDPASSFSESFDAGAAWAYLGLQAHLMGFHTHAMAGFDVKRAPVVLNVPPSFRVEVAVAVGSLGKREELPDPLRSQERPSGRKPLAALISEGAYRDFDGSSQ